MHFRHIYLNMQKYLWQNLKEELLRASKIYSKYILNFSGFICFILKGYTFFLNQTTSTHDLFHLRQKAHYQKNLQFLTKYEHDVTFYVLN